MIDDMVGLKKNKVYYIWGTWSQSSTKIAVASQHAFVDAGNNVRPTRLNTSTNHIAAKIITIDHSPIRASRTARLHLNGTKLVIPMRLQQNSANKTRS